MIWLDLVGFVWMSGPYLIFPTNVSLMNFICFSSAKRCLNSYEMLNENNLSTKCNKSGSVSYFTSTLYANDCSSLPLFIWIKTLFSAVLESGEMPDILGPLTQRSFF